MSDNAGGGGGPPGEEVITELTVGANTLPRDSHQPDGVLAAGLVAALDVGLSHRNVERSQRIAEELKTMDPSSATGNWWSK